MVAVFFKIFIHRENTQICDNNPFAAEDQYALTLYPTPPCQQELG